MNVKVHEKLHFGDFELDPPRGLLLRGGAPIKIQPQPLKVLACLAEQAGQIVTRDELRSRIWGEATYVEFDDGLNYCIRQIRLALGDDASDPKFIETLPRQGYRFIPALASTQDDASATWPTDIRPAGKRSRVWIAIAAALTVVLILSAWVLRDRSGTVTLEVALVRTLPLPGIEMDPAVSPDGSTLAFTWAGESGDHFGLYAISLNGGSYRQLTHSPSRDYSAAWSPDGKTIAFVRTGPKRRLMLVDVASGTERTLVPDLNVGLEVGRTNRPWIAWSPGGAIVTPMGDVDTGKSSLFAVDVQTGNAKRLFPTAPDREGESQPAVSPDGHWLAYMTVRSSWTEQLFVRRIGADLKPEGEPLAVSELGGRLAGPVWAPSGKSLYFGRRTQLMEWSQSGSPHVIYNAPSLIGSVAAAWIKEVPRFVLNAVPPAAETRKLALAANGLRAEGVSTPFLHSAPAYPFTPSFSPDGRLISYTGKISDDHDEVFIADADGTNHRQVTHGGYRDIGFQVWSPDSKQIAFHAFMDTGPRQLYVIDNLEAPNGAEVRRLTNSDRVPFAGPAFSLDGKFIYADRARDLALKNLVRIPSSGGPPEIWMEGIAPEETRDGRLIYGKLGKRGVFARSLGGDPPTNREERLVDDYTPPVPRLQVFPDGFYYLSKPDGGSEMPTLRFYNFATRRSINVTKIQVLAGSFTVAPDRRQLVYDAAVTDGVDFSIVEMRRAR